MSANIAIINSVFERHKIIPIIYDLDFLKASFDEYYIPKGYMGSPSEYEQLRHG